ncbi:V-type proton ATPase subunit G-like [Senna tora]|uniref:V-type proton ATPase subunit G-like n=1 Tax=Senna tora TaxID=362788 RepID=A0A834TPI3_9FABA|nr:V-type proton ATPase subunit G-like [Senna tora]
MDPFRGQGGIQMLLTAEQEAQHITSGNSGSNVKRLEEETETKINNLKGSASKVSTEIVDMLLKHVTSIKV